MNKTHACFNLWHSTDTGKPNFCVLGQGQILFFSIASVCICFNLVRKVFNCMGYCISMQMLTKKKKLMVVYHNESFRKKHDNYNAINHRITSFIVCY